MNKMQFLRRIVQLSFFISGPILLYRFPDMGYLILLVMILGGALFCGWFCPFGLLQDTAAVLGKKLGIKRRPVPDSLHRYAVILRYVIGVFLFAAPLGVSAYIKIVEPRHGLFHALEQQRLPSITVMVMITAFFLLSMRWERLYCRYICPQGAMNGMIGMLRIFTVNRDKERCISCKKCDRECPMQIQVSKADSLRSLQCIGCLKCVSACPVPEALEYGTIISKKRDRGWLKKEAA